MQKDFPASSRSFVVRPVVPDDVDLLEQLIVQLAAHHGDRATTNAGRLNADLFGASPWAVALVAEWDGGLLGHAFRVRLYQAHSARRVMELHHLFVVPAARDRGVGTALIRAATQAAEATECARLVVGTHPDNHRAQSFYRKLGFEDAPFGGPRFRLQLSAGM